ncbi:hypothetical protein EW145_g2038 [Phellinidium pouzarii]|uniref:Copper-fist domain-containing protein n=1 Tax=Phellinidium pouzarii TaxID=167371 RepID=A0A4S4LCL0_9AGAM|nr:hypothetical protein EW145_g2038 [Phellinidium pouzarii]
MDSLLHVHVTPSQNSLVILVIALAKSHTYIHSSTHPFLLAVTIINRMVYVNSKKYAWSVPLCLSAKPSNIFSRNSFSESCIKGHRSSSCHHNDRPLFEIKKKGRPVSQCEKCREARQARRIHAKCACETERAAAVPAEESVRKKGKRFIPTIPSLPNGLKDAFKTPGSSSTEPITPRQQVGALLNPCHCKDVYNCKCQSEADAGSNPTAHAGVASRKPVSSAFFSDGLSALALVASCCSPASPSTLPPIPSLAKLAKQPGSDGSILSVSDSSHSLPSVSSQIDTHTGPQVNGPVKRKRSLPSLHHEPSITDPSHSRHFRHLNRTPPVDLRIDSTGKYYAPRPFSPITSSQDPLSTSTSHSASIRTENASDDEAEDDCCCGTRCECAGCSLHGVPRHDDSGSWMEESTHARASTSQPTSASQAHADNAQDCPTCVDYDRGVELPPLSGVSVTSGRRASVPSFLDLFFARAASLPAPPSTPTRKTFDPTNVVVYPRSLFMREDGTEDELGDVVAEKTYVDAGMHVEDAAWMAEMGLRAAKVR